MKLIHFRAEMALLKEIQDYADERGISLSEVIRRALLLGLQLLREQDARRAGQR
jgi:hypothetical protein